MNFLLNLKIGARLALAFGAILTALAGVAILAFVSLGHVESKLTEIVQENNQEARLAVKMRIAINQVATALRNAVLLTDQADIQREADNIKNSRANYDAAEAELGKRFRVAASQAEKDQLAKVQSLAGQATTLTNEVLELARANKDEEAVRHVIKQAGPAQKAWLLALGELADVEEKLTNESSDSAEIEYRSARINLLVLSLVAWIGGIAAAWQITRSITRPLAQAVSIANTVAAGDLTSQIGDTGRDETGELLRALKRMNSSLIDVVGAVRLSSDSIATGSSQISVGNADLSQRTEEQASNLQQTAASMEQLNATVKANADIARSAELLASSASAVAGKGGEVVNRVVETMGDISTSSRKIADIISVIDGIAFQTNILALNAAVEAARAGEQGRGFAVVASEVRSLAHRSAMAAKEIKSLISDSVDKVEVGSRLVGDAGTTMHDIVNQVMSVAELIHQISTATAEQTSGITQVSEAVTQLDQVTQQNAALVEESAAAAESLKQQARRLVEVVGQFKITRA